MSCGESKVVCVTGASGFIASWLVNLLLRRGFTVKATVRDPNDQNNTEHLLLLDGAKDRLHLFKADLLEEGSFDTAIDGCQCVFHTASPVLLSVTDPQLSIQVDFICKYYNQDPLDCCQAELIDPALKGTLDVLRSCANTPSVKRVVLTSSIVSVMFNGKPLSPDVTVDETWFSDQTFCEKAKLWYPVSKVLAAWKFAKENRIDMLRYIQELIVIGLHLRPMVNTSMEPLLKLVNAYRWIDVRDVANAHILVFQNPSASGRYCLVGKVAHCAEAVKISHDIFPALNLPGNQIEHKIFDSSFESSGCVSFRGRCADDQPLAPTCQVSREKAQILGVKFTPLEVF
ncbi:putative cinnamyl-alcohol dehydrogenase [Rosa chinensis]|uniref:Putative cinnamyl-alcohol dehydrogenase n=1 Tax=Rosa chinensis TaxID=74649 RepID=A0A2P6S7X2_ROSCH|nr:putative cinnamyl-alcohol dehydrogenase [Rosa chinensis]